MDLEYCFKLTLNTSKGSTMFKKKLLVIFIALLLSCPSTNDTPKTEHKVIINEDGSSTYLFEYNNDNEFVYELMKEVYLWNDEMETLDDVNKYESPEDVMEALQVELDRWSYIEDKTVNDNYFNNGKMFGFGVNFFYAPQKDKTLELKVGHIQEDSELYEKGIRKGDTLVSIDELFFKTDGIGDDSIDYANTSLRSLHAKLTDGEAHTFNFKTKDNITYEYKLSPKYVEIKSVYMKKIFEENGKKIGFMTFSHFIQSSFYELVETFDFFELNGIDELIIDLRGNGGGMVNVAGFIIDILSGNKHAGKTSVSYIFNSNYEDQNINYLISNRGYNFNFDRVFFLTDNYTASSSEILINCLKPYLDVVLVGFTTHGKPVGMFGYEQGNKVYMPISVKFVNSKGEGDFFEGIKADSFVLDTMNYDYGKKDDPVIAEALNYIKTGFQSYNSRSIEPEISIIGYELEGFRAFVGLY